ncbi:chemotaxis protein CheW [Pelagicoccus sp. SDUM812003]|uniref:chemotaxis protein CheW n=1 Tax=Pelagicoccus sp. SDUM812003 TaxID=3041267 RepID=UPI00281046E5|nr:chemotaxis protein CheW [Pelagicoccus sp. SDUM812003]MDQ8201589.1 chemotaxis protein CheW [Pelagicoccus sp. SDUM812003]
MSNLTFDDKTSHTTFSSGKFLTFTLAEECYGVEVLKIREIIRMQKITPVPQMPEHVKGVINLRGKVIPVVDLRIKFNLPVAEATERTCIIVVDVYGGQGVNQLLGLVVDAVEEVLNVSDAEVEPSPDFGTRLSTECCLGIAKIKDSVKTLLDIEKVVSSELESGLGF